jgi:hypothetical protein
MDFRSAGVQRRSVGEIKDRKTANVFEGTDDPEEVVKVLVF